MTIIDNAPTVDTDEIYKKGYHAGFFATHGEPETKVVANVTFDKEQLEEIVEKAKADILSQIERPKGKWVIDNWGMYHCNCCMKEKQQLFHNFCSFCGANMIDEKENNNG